MANSKVKTRIRLFQAGDMPGINNRINFGQVKQLVKALDGLEAFGYTHKPPHVLCNAVAIKYCNDNGVTINLSANNLEHADELFDLNIGPVCTTLPQNASKHTLTPNGRRVIICPAVLSDDVTCFSCGGNRSALCARVDRDYIVGFPAHGNGAKTVSMISEGE